jgi:hypothetical protein
MAQTADELARDILVAWLSGNAVSFSLADAEKTGAAIGKVYKAVLQAVREGIESRPTGARAIFEAQPE